MYAVSGEEAAGLNSINNNLACPDRCFQVPLHSMATTRYFPYPKTHAHASTQNPHPRSQNSCIAEARPTSDAECLDRPIVKHEMNISRPQPVCSHKLGITRRSLVLGVASEHALQTQAGALDILHRRPALTAEEIQTDDAVGVNVWMYWYLPVCSLDEHDLGKFCRGVNVVGRLADQLSSKLAPYRWDKRG